MTMMLENPETRHGSIFRCSSVFHYQHTKELSSANIPVFYGEKAAREAGWVLTSERVFSRKGNLVWVCGTCHFEVIMNKRW